MCRPGLNAGPLYLRKHTVQQRITGGQAGFGGLLCCTHACLSPRGLGGCFAARTPAYPFMTWRVGTGVRYVFAAMRDWYMANGACVCFSQQNQEKFPTCHELTVF